MVGERKIGESCVESSLEVLARVLARVLAESQLGIEASSLKAIKNLAKMQSLTTFSEKQKTSETKFGERRQNLDSDSKNGKQNYKQCIAAVR